MIEWQAAYKALRERFTTQSKSRLDEMAKLIESLSQAHDCESSTKVLHDIRRHFHWLAGSGGIYGLPKLTQIGKLAEQYCQQLEKIGTASGDEIKEMLNYVDQLRAAYSESKPEAQTAEVLHVNEPLHQPKVLIVADGTYPEICQSAAERGMQPTFVGDTAKLDETIEDSEFDAAIVVSTSTESNPYEIVEKLRERSFAEEMPILMVSKDHPLDKVRAILCGADGYFEHSINSAEVIDKLYYLLERALPAMHKVLYVEDDPFQSNFVAEVLRTAGYDVCTCEDPAEFEHSLITHQPDLVILDIMLPGVSGFQLAKYIRADEAYATVPVLFLSTESQLENKVKASKYGGDDFLIKPVAPSLLLSVVAARLERARLLKSLVYRDGLTKLLTHSAFMHQGQSVVARKHRAATRNFGLVLIDIDQFKTINDTYGHPEGDRVIITLANVLKRRLRRSDAGYVAQTP